MNEENDIQTNKKGTLVSAECLQILNNLPIGVYKIAPNGEFINVNQTYATMLGYSSIQEIIEEGRVQLHYVNPEDRKKQIEQLKNTHAAVVQEIEFCTKNGQKFWGRDTAYPVLDTNNEIVSIEGTIENITGQKEAEQITFSRETAYKDLFDETKQQAKELKLLLKINKTLATELDPKKVVNFCVESISKHFDFKYVCLYLLKGNGNLYLEHKVGYERPLPNEISLRQGVMGRVARTGYPTIVNNPELDKDYLSFADDTIAEMAIPLFVEDKVYGVLNIESNRKFTPREQELCIAIGESLVVAAERARLYISANSTKKLFRAIMDDSADGIFVMNNENIITDWNYGQEKITGVLRNNAIGVNIKKIPEMMVTENSFEYKTFLGERTVAREQNNDFQGEDNQKNTVEWIFENNSGERRYVQISFSLIDDNNPMISCYARDMTEYYLNNQAEQKIS